MGHMVNFPKANRTIDFYRTGDDLSGWSNTGEGGLFAYAVVRASEATLDHKENCFIDVWSMLNQPDVQVSDVDLWDRGDNLSEILLASVFLGSTNESLVNNGGDYFTVTVDDLNDAGKALVASLSVIGKVEILTFLDT